MTNHIANLEFTPEASEPALRFNRLALLEALQAIVAAQEAQQLREHVQILHAELANPHSFVRNTLASMPAVSFTLSYLHAELHQIATALTLERAHYYAERLRRAIEEDPRCAPINDINLNRWKEYGDILTDSLWQIDRRDSSGVHRADYWGNFIPQIPNQMMRRYTRPGDWVLDTFAGLGTTLIEAQRLGRHSLGIELQPHVVDRAQELLLQEQNAHAVQCEVRIGDAAAYDVRAQLQAMGTEKVQLILMHPPYFDIIKFSDDSRDLSNAPSVEQFLTMMGAVIDNVAPVLERGRYLVLVIGDKYARGDWIPLGFQTMNTILERGFSLKSIVVKNFETTAGKRTRKELWRYRALAGGFYVFKHEYIFVFRKR